MIKSATDGVNFGGYSIQTDDGDRCQASHYQSVCPYHHKNVGVDKSRSFYPIVIMDFTGVYQNESFHQHRKISWIDYTHIEHDKYRCATSHILNTKKIGEELFPLVDEEGNVIGSASRKKCHDGSKPLHPVVHLHLFDNQGKIFLQKRSVKKDIQPGKWDTSVGGHVDFGETIDAALRREAREELGITEFTPRFIDKYLFESTIEKELIHVFATRYDGTIQIDNDELEDGGYFTSKEINDMIDRQITTPNFAGEYQKYREIFTTFDKWK